MSSPDFPNGNADLTPDRIKTDAAALADTAQADLSHLADEVKEQASALGEEARSQLADVTDKAKGMAADQKDLLVDQLDGVTGALKRAAGELETNGDAGGRYVRMLADGADKLVSTVRDNDVDQIIGIAQDFGRKQPVAFMGAAALLGFVASRFVMASGSRKSETEAATQPVTNVPSQTYGGQSSTGATSTSTYGGTPSYGQPVGGKDGGL
jgi:ElaB/YqjD/DUF883 family membrane-anchored ribosome-binding protein